MMKWKNKEFAVSVAVGLMALYGVGYAQAYFQMPPIVVVFGVVAVGLAAIIALIK